MASRLLHLIVVNSSVMRNSCKISVNSKMLPSEVCLVLLLFVGVIGSSAVFQKNSIHHFMDEKELQYYFGTESKFYVPHYEVVEFAARKQTDNDIEDTLHLNLKAFDEEIPLKLKINKNLVSPFMRFVEKFNGTGERELHGRSNDCHYLHNDDETSASISGCSSANIVRITRDRGMITDGVGSASQHHLLSIL